MYTDNYLKLPWGKIWYRIINKESKNIPLLILHGGPAFPSDYLFTLEKLADERPVIFYDQSGCGRSDHSLDKNLWSVAHFVEELALIRKELKLDYIHLCAHSWGTMLATDYLLTQPNGIRSVIFAGPCINAKLWEEATSQYLDELPNHQGNLIRKYEKEGNTKAPEYKTARHLYHTTYECRIDPEPAIVQASNAGFNPEIYRYMWGPNEYTPTGTLKNYNRSDRLNEIKLPALFTCGEYDGASPKATEFYHSQIPGAELKIFENSSHMPHLEEETEYLDVVRSFLKKHDK